MIAKQGRMDGLNWGNHRSASIGMQAYHSQSTAVVARIVGLSQLVHFLLLDKLLTLDRDGLMIVINRHDQ